MPEQDPLTDLINTLFDRVPRAEALDAINQRVANLLAIAEFTTAFILSDERTLDEFIAFMRAHGASPLVEDRERLRGELTMALFTFATVK
jgi:hypothetical protein